MDHKQTGFRLDSYGSRMAGTCKLSSSIKGRKILDLLSTYQLFMKDSIPRSYSVSQFNFNQVQEN